MNQTSTPSPRSPMTIALAVLTAILLGTTVHFASKSRSLADKELAAADAAKQAQLAAALLAHGEGEEAKTVAERVMTSSPNEPTARFVLARIAMATGDHAGAEVHLRAIVEGCAARGVPLTLCGKMAGRPLEAMALVGVGLRRLSMSPTAIGPVKEMLRSLDAAEVAAFLDTLVGLPDASLRGRLVAFARDRGVVV